MFPNTTFKKEVIEKIENKEISSLLLMEWTGSEEDIVILKNRADIDYILDSLAPLKFKKMSKLPDTSKETYYIIIKDQGKRSNGKRQVKGQVLLINRKIKVDNFSFFK